MGRIGTRGAARRMSGWLCLGVIALLFVGCEAVIKSLSEVADKRAGRVEEWSDACGTVLRDQRYGQRTNNAYDLFLPKGGTKNGLLLFIHGGSWMGGDKQEMEYACRRYAKMGYVTATMNYSFINSKTEYGSLPTMDGEVVACVRSIASLLAKRGIRVGNLAVGGHSAGAQIAATYAMKHVGDSPVPLRFAIIEAGPVALSEMFAIDESKLAKIRQGLRAGKTNVSGKQDVDNMVMNASGVTMRSDMYYKEKVDELVNRSSAASLVSGKSVPVIMAYGAKDFIVKPAQYKALAAAYQRHGRPYTLIVYPNSGHNLDSDADKTAELQSTVKKYLERYFVK